MAKDSAKSSKQEEAEAVDQASGAPVPAGTQISQSAGPGRRTHDVSGRPVPEDEQLLEPE